MRSIQIPHGRGFQPPLGHLIHTHPTLLEAVMETALDVTGDLIHFQHVTTGAQAISKKEMYA